MEYGENLNVVLIFAGRLSAHTYLRRLFKVFIMREGSNLERHIFLPEWTGPPSTTMEVQCVLCSSSAAILSSFAVLAMLGK